MFEKKVPGGRGYARGLHSSDRPLRSIPLEEPSAVAVLERFAFEAGLRIMSTESDFKYISCFSGIGGLESTSPPLLVCEIDPKCVDVLRSRFPDAVVHGDIRNLRPPQADVVAGGWPCQDVSVAGKQAGLAGSRSGLLSELLRVAQEAKAPTVVAENVSNLLRMRNGQEFQDAIAMFHEAGFTHVAWRLLNARDFGLPQHRTRLIFVASRDIEIAETLFRPTPELQPGVVDEAKRLQASGFYWTAGTHSINFSQGYVPTVKIGSSLSIPSPPAVLYGDVVRQLSPHEALKLQGFTIVPEGIANADLFRMAGNAVPVPIGAWVLEGVRDGLTGNSRATRVARQMCLFREAVTRNPDAGISSSGSFEELVTGGSQPRAVNLIDFLDTSSTSRLSVRAASGLLARLDRSGQACPESLRRALSRCAEADRF